MLRTATMTMYGCLKKGMKGSLRMSLFGLFNALLFNFVVPINGTINLPVNWFETKFDIPKIRMPIPNSNSDIPSLSIFHGIWTK